MGLSIRLKKMETIRFAATLFAACATLSLGLHADSLPQRLVIRIINVDSGGPMSHQNVLVEWDEDAEESTVFVGGNGRGTMEILPGGNNFTMKPGVKNYGDPNRLAYFNCNGEAASVSIEQATRSGFVPPNNCNDRTAQAKPGEIIFWARPLPLWKPDFQ